MSSATSDQIREVYARFGAAYYDSEVLRVGICSFYAVSSMPPAGGTRRRFDELFATADAEPLGAVVTMVAKRLQPELSESLREAADTRNFLAHRFWSERIEMMTTEEGVLALTEELIRYSDLFQRIDTDMRNVTSSILERLGIEETTIEQAVADVVAGVPMRPIEPERRLRKKETIVAVYDVPGPSGGSTLIFVTSDNRFWQLCDVGLGWSPFRTIDASWRHNEILAPCLPVDVDPRPNLRTPWNYGIDLGGRAVLRVRLGEDGLFRWTVKRLGEDERRRGTRE